MSGRMDNNGTDLDQIQPIYLAQAQVFVYDPDKTKLWVPMGEIPVPISILHDSTRGIYRIISVDAECQTVILNSTVFPDLEFHKTSQKFVHWTDQSSGTIYGIGFASEYEHESFFECLKKVRAAVVGLLKEPSSYPANTSDPMLDSGSGKQVALAVSSQHKQHQSQGEGTNRSYQTAVTPSWTDYENLGIHLASLLNEVNKTQAELLPAPGSSRQATFRINTPSKPFTSPRIDEIICKAPLYKSPVEFLRGQDGGPQTSARRQEPSLELTNRNTNGSASTQGLNSPNRMAPDSTADEVRGCIVEIHRLKAENFKLKEALIESSSNVKKSEVQLDSLRSSNAQLVTTTVDMTSEIDELKKEITELRDQSHRQATTSGTRFQNVKMELEDKVRQLSGEKARLETIVKDFENNARLHLTHESSIGSLGPTSSSGQMVSSKRAEEMEDYYRKLLNETKKKLDGALAAHREGMVAVHRVDGTFVKSIHELIAVHDQLRNAYNQNKNIPSKNNQS